MIQTAYDAFCEAAAAGRPRTEVVNQDDRWVPISPVAFLRSGLTGEAILVGDSLFRTERGCGAAYEFVGVDGDRVLMRKERRGYAVTVRRRAESFRGEMRIEHVGGCA